MKALSVTVFLALLSFSASAIDTAIVKLMQKVIDLKIPTGFPYFYLLDTADSPKSEVYFIEEAKRNNISSPIPFDEFLSSLKSDTSTQIWSANDLRGAKYIDKQHLTRHPHVSTLLENDTEDIVILKFSGAIIQRLVDSQKVKHPNAIIVAVKATASKKRIAEATIKAKRAHDKEIKDRPPYEQMYFSFSKPIFSRDKKYAVISVSYYYGGSQCIFKNYDGHWELVYEKRVAY